MALNKNQVTAMLRTWGMPKMVKANVVQRGGRLKGRNMTAHIGIFIRTQHHRHGIPAGVRTNSMLDVLIAGNAGLQLHRDGINVRRFSMKGLIYTIDSGMGYLLIN